jgi:hypothetical protein
MQRVKCCTYFYGYKLLLRVGKGSKNHSVLSHMTVNAVLPRRSEVNITVWKPLNCITFLVNVLKVNWFLKSLK